MIISSEKNTHKDTNATGFVCPNPSCHKIFDHPLKAVNVGISNGSYLACPFCLTEISGSEKPVPLVPEEAAQSPKETQQTEPEPKSPGCKNYFGFLSARPSKTAIPDECLTCKRTLQCMLTDFKESQ